MSETTAKFKKQLPRNGSFQAGSFATHLLAGLWLVPYLLEHLGKAAYGLIPLAAVMTQYVSLISQSLSHAVGRFLTIALQKNRPDEANEIFNTAFFSYGAIGLVQAPVFIVIIYHANSVFSIPANLYQDALILLSCSSVAFIVTLITSVFSVPAFAFNRLDISRGLDIAGQILRVIGIVGFFSIAGAKLSYVGYVNLGIAVLSAVVQIGVARRLAPTLKVSVSSFRSSRVRELTAMGGWMVIGQVGALIFLRTDVWVVNRFLGAELAGGYAAITPWASLVRQGGMLLSSLIAPMAVIYYAHGKIDSMIRMSRLGVRLLSLLLAAPVSFLCIFSADLLGLWLGESYRSLAPLMVIMVCHLVINVGVIPLFPVRTAVNKVRLPGLMSLFMGGLNLALSILLATSTPLGIYGVAIAGAVSLTLVNAIWNPLYMAAVLEQKWHTFLSAFVAGLASMAILLAVAFGLKQLFVVDSWLDLFFLACTLGALGICLCFAMLPRNDLIRLIDLAPPWIRRAWRLMMIRLGLGEFRA